MEERKDKSHIGVPLFEDRELLDNEHQSVILFHTLSFDTFCWHIHCDHEEGPSKTAFTFKNGV